MFGTNYLGNNSFDKMSGKTEILVMAHVESFIWFLIPILINGILILSTENKLPVVNKKYVIIWLLSIGIIGLIFSPECMCLNHIDMFKGALIGSLIYSLAMFIFYAFVVFVRSKM